MTTLLALFETGGNALHFLVGFMVLVCVLAIVIIAVRWLLALAGITVPQPLMVILGILLFLLAMLWLLNYSGYYRF